MIGLVIVSHSAKLAEGTCDLARQVARDAVQIAAAGGTADPEHPLGTDAFRVLQAIESVYSEDGVLVLMDLGSAVLSASTALEFLDEARRSRVRLCAGPLVEGSVAAACLAAAGATLEEIEVEARNALSGKISELGGSSDESEAAADVSREDAALSAEAVVRLVNPLGLHARPAAQLVRLARRYQARVTLQNLTLRTRFAAGDSINGALTLGARQGHELRICARGREADDAVAALTSFIASGCGEGERHVERIPDRKAALLTSPSEHQLRGIPASAGVAVGPLLQLRVATAEAKHRAAGSPASERMRLMAALHAAGKETGALFDWTRAHFGADEAAIFDAQSLFLEDPELLAEVTRLLHDGLSAESAWQAAATKIADGLCALDDPYLRARAADVNDVAARVLRKLTGEMGGIRRLDRPAVLTAHDLTPSEVKDLDSSKVLALCLESGSASAHSTILARAMGIPVVAGLGTGISAVSEGTIVGVDGEQGVVWLSPDSDEVRSIEVRRDSWLTDRRRAEAERLKPASTRDGWRIRVFANVSGIAEAAEAVALGAEGVGVLRTEFLFLGRTAAPSEEEQTAAYSEIAGSLGGRPLTIRTLDVGGDKTLPYLEIGEEANPFLGWRGIRVTLGRRDLFRTQLRAILRTGANHPIEILLPMIASLDELRESKATIAEAQAELQREGLAFGRNIRIGVMIEVPAAVAIADRLAREAGFFSIGTNDLVQYVMAADRTNPRVAPIADPFQPAVLRSIRQTIEAARGAGIPVTLCGELAADRLATPLLLGLGLDEFSVSASLIPELKQAVSSWTAQESEALAREALAMDTSLEVRRLLERAAANRRG